MKKFFALFMMLLTILSCSATENDVPQLASASDGTLFNGKKVLVAYFSWGGTTRRMAETIENVTKGDIFEIEPVVPYPTSYTPCTEVALEEKNNNARPEIKNRVENWADYDIVFIGCPVVLPLCLNRHLLRRSKEHLCHSGGKIGQTIRSVH